MTNLPLIFKRVSRPILYKVAWSTTLQVAVGVAVLTSQRFLVIH